MPIANGDGGLPPTLFGFPLSQNTGAPGSPGATEADAAPDNWMTVPVVAVNQTSQGQLPQVSVGVDDSLTPSQHAAYSGHDKFVADEGGFGATGAGSGNTFAKHPNSTARPS